MLPDDLPVTGPNVNATALHGYLKHAFGRAQRLGAKVIALDGAKSRAVPDDGDFPFAWRQLGNFLRLVQGHAHECGLTVALEPLRKSDCNLLNLVSEATLIAGLLQLSNIAVAAHWGHMALASEPLSSLRRAAASARVRPERADPRSPPPRRRRGLRPASGDPRRHRLRRRTDAVGDDCGDVRGGRRRGAGIYQRVESLIMACPTIR